MFFPYVKKTKEYIQTHFHADELNKGALPEDHIYVEEFLKRLNFTINLDERSVHIFDFIVKKVEVLSVLREKYSLTTPLSKKANPVSPDVWELLLCQCILLYLEKHNFKYVNTILKVTDSEMGYHQYKPRLAFSLFLEDFLNNVL